MKHQHPAGCDAFSHRRSRQPNHFGEFPLQIPGFHAMSSTQPRAVWLIFDALSVISVLVSTTALLLFGARGWQAAKKNNRPVVFTLSPHRNPFFFHVCMFSACAVYHVATVMWRGSLQGLKGATRGQYEATRVDQHRWPGRRLHFHCPRALS